MYTPRIISEEPALNNMMSADELAGLMSKNGGKVLDNVDKSEVSQAAWLRDHLSDGKVAENEEFQEAFNTAFKLGGRRFSNALKARLYQIMDNAITREHFDFYEAFHELYEGTTQPKLSPTQFALLSKVANTLSENFPIYESALGDMMGFKKPTSTKDTAHDRMREYMKFYDHVQYVYSQLPEKPGVSDLLKVFKIQHREFAASIPMNKRVDLLVRSAAALHSKGAML